MQELITTEWERPEISLRKLVSLQDTKGTFLAKMGKVKDRNSMDLTEAEEIKKWQEYTEELLKKVLMIGITTMVWSLT